MTEPAFLLDSTICIYILDDAASQPARRVQAQPVGRVITSAIVAAEVIRGLPDEDAVAKARRLFSAIPIVAFDEAAAVRFHQVPFQRGRFDRLIAAHALALGVTLVTNNERDLADIPGLMVENWTLPPA